VSSREGREKDMRKKEKGGKIYSNDEWRWHNSFVSRVTQHDVT
jgi:hypothetical protein